VKVSAVFASVIAVGLACGKRDGSASVVVAADAAAATLQDECAAATANMSKVMPDEVSGDAADLADCMKLPRPVVRCLIGVRSKTEADACVKGYAEPEVRATEAECKQAIAHVRGVLGKPLSDSDDALVAQCVRTATAADIKCLQATTSAADLKQCGFEAD
jgi:hypothetical protein